MIQGPFYPPRTWFPPLDDRNDLERQQAEFADEPEFEPGIEYEQSTITIPLKLEKVYGDQVYELLVFDAFMKLRREAPEEYNIAAPGHRPITRRQFRFKIEHWELVGKSNEGIFTGAFSRAFDAFISIALAQQITDLQSANDHRRIEGLEAEIHQVKKEARQQAKTQQKTDEKYSLKLLELRKELNEIKASINKQPYSICHADQMGEDFPATIVYNAHFDIWQHQLKKNENGFLGPELITSLILENQAGVATANKVVEIPPRDVMVAFEKPYENKELGIKFSSGSCSGMRHITREQFLEGANRGRALRGLQPLVI